MNYNLLENGVDSLKAAYENLDSFFESEDTGEHYLKDAIIFLNHGVEILLKYLISQRSQALLFVDINKYLLAKEEMVKKSLGDVFEADSKLRTITLEDSIKRAEYACDLELPRVLKASIFYLLKLRNKLMHYGISLKQVEVTELVGRLEICYEETIKFFSSHISDFRVRFDNSRFILKDIVLLQRQHDKLLEEMENAAIRANEESYQDYLADQSEALENYEIKNDK